MTVLGSAGTYPHPGNPCSGYLVQSPTTAVWLDAGTGTFGPLQEHVALSDLDAIVVSHEHPDHCLELPVVRNAARYVFEIESIPVYGTAGTRELLEAVVGGPLDPPFRWTDVTDGSSVQVGDISFDFSQTDHPVETLAVRAAANGRVFGYSSDTGTDWSFERLDPHRTGFDLVVCEATLPGEQAGSYQHLTATEAGAMCAAAQARRLALTHMYEGVEHDRVKEAEAPDAFGGPVETARPGYTFTV